MLKYQYLTNINNENVEIIITMTWGIRNYHFVMPGRICLRWEVSLEPFIVHSGLATVRSPGSFLTSIAQIKMNILLLRRFFLLLFFRHSYVLFGVEITRRPRAVVKSPALYKHSPHFDGESSFSLSRKSLLFHLCLLIFFQIWFVYIVAWCGTDVSVDFVFVFRPLFVRDSFECTANTLRHFV